MKRSRLGVGGSEIPVIHLEGPPWSVASFAELVTVDVRAAQQKLVHA